MSTKNVRKIYIGLLVLVEIMTAIGIYLYFSVDYTNITMGYAKDMAVDCVGMLVCGVLLIGLYAGNKEDRQNRAMFRIIFLLTTLFLVDLISSCIEGNARFVTGIIIVNTLGFIFEDILGYTYWTYIREELKLSGRLSRVADKIALTAICVNIFLDVINVKFGIFFTVSETGEYISSPLEFLADIAIIAIFILVIIAIIHTKNIKINEKLILMSFEIFPFIGYIAEDLMEEYTWIYLAYLLSVLLIYIRIFSNK